MTSELITDLDLKDMHAEGHERRIIVKCIQTSTTYLSVVGLQLGVLLPKILSC